jgi:pantothenate kinase
VDPHSRVVLVEGNYILLWDVTPWGQLKHVFDETWFVDVDLDTARTRIIKACSAYAEPRERCKIPNEFR